VSRRAAIVAGVAAVAAYAGLAMVSGHLSPLARGPLLDGIGPPQPYRWVNPPPDLAADNVAPSAGVFPVPLAPGGSEAQAFVTSDDQVTVVVPEGTFKKRPGQIEVTLTVNPVDPATLASPGKGLDVFGNAYRFSAAYVPSDDPATLALPLDVTLMYPVTLDLHAALHQVHTSADGTTWIAQEGSDSLAQQQAEGPLPQLGYAMVAGDRRVPPAQRDGGGSTSIAIVLIVLAGCIGLVGIGLIVRGGRRG
jgi:hypothetical protein